MTLLDLANLLEDHRDDIREDANRMSKVVTMKLLLELVRATPIDTAYADCSWHVYLNEPQETILPEPYVPDGRLGEFYSQNAAIILRKAFATLDKKKPGERVYICNAAPYINELNAGSSEQAGPHYIEHVIAWVRSQYLSGQYDKTRWVLRGNS